VVAAFSGKALQLVSEVHLLAAILSPNRIFRSFLRLLAENS
jgi:hypothetical protein